MNLRVQVRQPAVLTTRCPHFWKWPCALLPGALPTSSCTQSSLRSAAGTLFTPAANSQLKERVSKLERIDMKTALTHGSSTPIKYMMWFLAFLAPGSQSRAGWHQAAATSLPWHLGMVFLLSQKSAHDIHLLKPPRHAVSAVQLYQEWKPFDRALGWGKIRAPRYGWSSLGHCLSPRAPGNVRTYLVWASSEGLQRAIPCLAGAVELPKTPRDPQVCQDALDSQLDFS